MAEIKNLADSKWFPKRRRTIRRTIPFLLIGLLIFTGYLYLFVDIPEMFATLQTTDLFYYLLAATVLLIDMLAYSLTWHYFLRPLSIDVPFRRTFLIIWIGVFVEFFVPSESIGEDASRTYLMTKESGENTGKVVASVLGHRILTMAVTLIALIVCSFSLLMLQSELPALVSNLILLIVVGTTIPLIFILFLCLKRELMQKLVDLLLRFFVFVSRGRLVLASLRSKAKKALNSFHQSIEILSQNPRSMFQPVFFSVLNYLLSIVVSHLVFISLGKPQNFVLLTIVYSISRSIQSIPTMLPGEVGFIEIVMTSLYVLLGVPLDVSAAATVLTRVLWVWLRLPLGFVAVQWAVNRGLV